MLKEELRARRNSAEQVNPSSQTNRQKWQKGVTTMARKVQNRLYNLLPVSLVILGWIAFIVGQTLDVINPYKLILLTVARVLP